MAWQPRRLDQLKAGDRVRSDTLNQATDHSLYATVTWVSEPEDDGFTSFNLTDHRWGDQATTLDVWVDDAPEATP